MLGKSEIDALDRQVARVHAATPVRVVAAQIVNADTDDELPWKLLRSVWRSPPSQLSVPIRSARIGTPALDVAVEGNGPGGRCCRVHSLPNTGNA